MHVVQSHWEWRVLGNVDREATQLRIELAHTGCHILGWQDRSQQACWTVEIGNDRDTYMYVSFASIATVCFFSMDKNLSDH